MLGAGIWRMQGMLLVLQQLLKDLPTPVARSLLDRRAAHHPVLLAPHLVLLLLGSQLCLIGSIKTIIDELTDWVC